MIDMKTIQVPIPHVQPSALLYFRYGYIADRVLITNDAGEWSFLTQEQFQELLSGKIDSSHSLFVELQGKNFLRQDLDVEQLATKIRRKKHFLGNGPHLHPVIVTLRCNQSCRYCHASRTSMDRVDTDMTIETAKGVVDMALQSPSPYICFEYTGGEPTINLEVIKFMVEYAKEKNRYEKKTIDHSIVTNMTYMTEETAKYLIENNFWICTSLDGPEEIHNWNRTWQKGSSAFTDVLHWIKKINQMYIDQGKDPELYHVDALMTTSRKTLENWKELVDLYVSLGIRNIHIRPLNPFGFANKTWKIIGYSMDEYVAFYKNVFDYIIELNKQGVQIMEGTAATFLKKILTNSDPNFVDIRSPIGSGTGQLAYNYNGNIYPSDEGRMVAAMGDEYFLLGHVSTATYDAVANHPTVKSMAVASLLDTLPACSSCWNAPFCGVRPMHNYMHTKDLFGQRPNTLKCKEHMGIVKILFSYLLEDKDGAVEKIFKRWIVDRPR